MSARRRLALSGALLAVALAAPTGAAAGPPGAWTPVGTTDQLNVSDLVGLARTADGTLHVAWHRRTANGLYDLLTTPVTRRGAVGAAAPVVTGWASIEGPSLVAQGNGLAAFWSGTRTLVTGDPTEGLDMATSGDGGATWAMGPSAVAQGDFASSRDAGVAAVGSSFLESWYAGEETVVHAGLDKGVANQRGYGNGTNQAIASSGSTAVVAWCTSVQGPNGVFTQGVDPATGSPAGPAALMPGSTAVIDGAPAASCPASARTPLVARAGGGYFVVATDGNRRTVRVWRVGAPASRVLAAGSAFKQQLAVAADPAGRLWAGWMEDGKLRLRRSNKAATAFGARVTVASPPGDGGAYQLDLSAQGDRVDAVARTSGTSGGVALFHTQSYPGLTLQAAGGRRARFRVTDAGDPVAGATIRVGAKRLRTDGAGRATGALPPGHYRATAVKRAYVSASARLTVKRR